MWSKVCSIGAAAVVVMMGWGHPAQALRTSYRAEDAQQGSVELHVWPGSGTNLDFSALGESIYRVWLDDPSRITVDFDSDPQDVGAQIIHLRRIEMLDFEGLPAAPRTLLTVVTVDDAGQRTVYQFPVFYSSGTPSYSTVALTPAPAISASSSGLAASPLGGVTLEAVLLGLDLAISDGTISGDGPMATKVREFAQLVQNGSPLPSAATTLGLDLRVVQELARRGAGPSVSHVSDTPDAALATPPADADWLDRSTDTFAETEPVSEGLEREVLDRVEGAVREMGEAVIETIGSPIEQIEW